MWASQLTSPSIPEDDTCSGGYAERSEMFNQIREILTNGYDRIVFLRGKSQGHIACIRSKQRTATMIFSCGGDVVLSDVEFQVL